MCSSRSTANVRTSRRARSPRGCIAPHSGAPSAARGRRRRPAPMWLEDLQLEPAALGDSPETARVSGLLERAVSELPRRFREVFLLCEVERVPQEEVAQILACAKKTISTRLFRAPSPLLRSVPPALAEH